MFDTTIVLSPLYGWAKPDFDVQSSEIVPFWWVCLEVPYYSMGSYESESFFHLDLGFQHPGCSPGNLRTRTLEITRFSPEFPRDLCSDSITIFGAVIWRHPYFGRADHQWASTNLKEVDSCHTVDGRNLAPVDMVNISLFTRFHACWVVSQISEPSTVVFHRNDTKPQKKERLETVFPNLEPFGSDERLNPGSSKRPWDTWNPCKITGENSIEKRANSGCLSLFSGTCMIMQKKQK